MHVVQVNVIVVWSVGYRWTKSLYRFINNSRVASVGTQTLQVVL